MFIRKALLYSVAALFACFSVALAKPPGGHLNITQVMVDDPNDPTSITIVGEDLLFGPKGPTVTLGGHVLTVAGTLTDTRIEAMLPPLLASGDYLLTVSGGEGQSQNDEYDLTIGAVGPKGEQGPQGETGPIGAQGPEGDQGPQGEQGIQGPQGVPGLQGPQGEIGPQGPRGEMGLQGLQGAEGQQGPQGEQGLLGEQGPQGLMGPPGDDGAIGPQGIPGPQGDIGPRGIQGEQGLAGLQGEQGVAGTPGADGQPGPQGAQGIPGPQGARGFTGSPGRAGSPGPRGPAGPSSDEQPPVPPVIGVAFIDSIEGDSLDPAYLEWFNIRSLKFSVASDFDYAGGRTGSHPNFSDIEITIDDQPAAAIIAMKLLTGDVIPEVQIVLLASPRTGGFDELLKLKLTDVIFTQAQPISSNDPDDPRIVKLQLNALRIEVTKDSEEFGYNLREASVIRSCGLSDPLVFANAPGGGSFLRGIPTYGYSIDFGAAITSNTGQSRMRGNANLSDVVITTGLVPETPCLFGGSLIPFDGDVVVENYDLPSDLNPSSTLELNRADIRAFSFETNTAGGMDVKVTIWYAKIRVSYDHGGVAQEFDKDLLGYTP